MSSAVEAETMGVFHNTNIAVPIRTTLIELGHPKPHTTIRTDNSTSHGILTSTICQKIQSFRYEYILDQRQDQTSTIGWIILLNIFRQKIISK